MMLQNRPGVEAMKRKLAERSGESPDDYAGLTLALWMMAHGAAMLLIAKTILPKDLKAARAVFTNSVRALLPQGNEVGRPWGYEGENIRHCLLA